MINCQIWYCKGKKKVVSKVFNNNSEEMLLNFIARGSSFDILKILSFLNCIYPVLHVEQNLVNAFTEN